MRMKPQHYFKRYIKESASMLVTMVNPTQFIY